MCALAFTFSALLSGKKNFSETIIMPQNNPLYAKNCEKTE